MRSPASKVSRSGEAKPFAVLRKEMVARNIAARGVRDERVLEAMRKVPRELFLPGAIREFAYEDSPLPIAGEQTISQPYIVAFMSEALLLQGGEKVLEIGAGSGYAAAVLSEIAADVYTVERIGQLAEKAAATLADLGYDNVHVLHGDGTKGWPEHASYDAIVVAAGGPQVPESLKEQLKIGGRLVIPVGADQRSQELVRVTRISEKEYRSEDIADVRFVPLIGEQGWAAATKRGALGRARLLRQVAPGDDALVRDLRKHNGTVAKDARVAFHGLDLYSLYDSIRSVLNYLDEVDPGSARVARERYGCLTPWQRDPATYGHAALTGSYPTCEADVVHALTDLLAKRRAYAEHDGERFLDAAQNARLVANAERYYRIMYYGSRASWNLRDSHMFDTLKNLLAFHGAGSKAVVWAHNSHVGNAAATGMAARGEHNIGQLCREEFGDQAYLIGFGTHSGTVAAATEWGGPMEVKNVRPALADSYEQLCHATGLARFMLGLRGRKDLCGPKGLGRERLERAIGVIYRPDTERESHYFEANLPRQFDEYVWFDDTSAVTPLDTAEIEGLPDTYPFGV